MKPDQEKIFFLTGDESVEQSPFLEQFKKHDYEVLFLSEPLDEYVVQQVTTFNDKKLSCISKGDVDFGTSLETMKNLYENFEKMCDHIKLQLGEKVEKVILSQRLTETPCILSTSELGWSSHMEKIMKLQALRSKEMNTIYGRKTNIRIESLSSYNY